MHLPTYTRVYFNIKRLIKQHGWQKCNRKNGQLTKKQHHKNGQSRSKVWIEFWRQIDSFLQPKPLKNLTRSSIEITRYWAKPFFANCLFIQLSRQTAQIFLRTAAYYSKHPAVQDSRWGEDDISSRPATSRQPSWAVANVITLLFLHQLSPQIIS